MNNALWDLGLGYRMQIRIRHGQVLVSTPACHDLEKALAAFKRLDCFRTHRRGAGFWRLRWHELRTFEDYFQEFRTTYLSMIEGVFGQRSESAALRLDHIHVRTMPYRQRLWEGCERHAMLLEERRQRMSSRLECQHHRQTAALERWNRVAMQYNERQQRRLHRVELKLERRNRLAMRKEDRSSSKRQQRERRQQARVDMKLVRKLQHFLGRWRRADERHSAQELRRRVADQLKSERRALRETSRWNHAMAIEKKRLWKHMNRRDITMEELLHLDACGR